MKTNSKKWLKRLGIFLGTLILIVVGYVVYVFSSYYRLEDKQKLTITGKSTEKAKTKNVLYHDKNAKNQKKLPHHIWKYRFRRIQ